MKLVVLSDKCIENILAKPVYSKTGIIVLNKGAKLSRTAVRKLKEFGIHSIYIEAEGTEDIVVEDAIDIETQLKAIKSLEEVFESVKKKGSFDEYLVKDIVKENLDKISVSESTLLISNGVRNMEYNIYIHSLNVAILSAFLGIKLGYNYDHLYNLTLGAILHDIGYAVTNGNDHTVKGIEILRKRNAINVTSYIVALQHHEKVDGSGYPNGQKGNDIYEFSKIVAICNEYDNLISKDGLQPFEALEQIVGKASTYFDKDIVKVFQKSMYVYPTGIEVKLSNGEVGVVCQQNKDMPTRPIVKTKDRYYNLLEELTLFIDKKS